jgi:hypothetical protein
MPVSLSRLTPAQPRGGALRSGAARRHRPCAALSDDWQASESETAKLTQAQLLRRKTQQAIEAQEELVRELRDQEERFARLEASLSAAKRSRDVALSPEEVAVLTEAVAVLSDAERAAVLARDPWAAAVEAPPPQLPPLPEPTEDVGWPAADAWASPLRGAFAQFAALASSALAQLRAAPTATEGERLALKAALLKRVAGLDRGARASTADRLDVETLVAALAALSPTASPAASSLGEGRWNVVYTTSPELLGAGLPALLRPAGPLYLTFNGPEGRAGLDVTWPRLSERGGLAIRSRTEVQLSLTSVRLFELLPLPARAAGRDVEFLETLYLDADLRVMRGARSCLLVAIMADSSYKLDAPPRREMLLPAGRASSAR